MRWPKKNMAMATNEEYGSGNTRKKFEDGV
jgi:hypothetical protein